MPARLLRDAITSSRKINALRNWGAEVLYYRLLTKIDDFGRYFADPQMLLGTVYPKQMDFVTIEDILEWKGALCEVGLINLYEVDDEVYLQFTRVFDAPRAKSSKFPAPQGDDICAHLHADANKCMQAHADAPGRPNTNTNTNNEYEEGGCGGEVERVLDAYPLKVDITAARAEIAAALKKRPFTQLLADVKAYAASRQGEDPRFTLSTPKWFREERWLDDLKISQAQQYDAGTETRSQAESRARREEEQRVAARRQSLVDMIDGLPDQERDDLERRARESLNDWTRQQLPAEATLQNNLVLQAAAGSLLER